MTNPLTTSQTAALEARLFDLAGQGRTLTYGALARELGLRVGELTAALEALMEQDARAGLPLRAALCEGKLSVGLPAKGFFDKATELGFAIGDPADFTAHHRAALFGN